MFRIVTPISVEGREMAAKTDSEAMKVSCQCVSAAGGTGKLNKETGCRRCRAWDLWPKPLPVPRFSHLYRRSALLTRKKIMNMNVARPWLVPK